MSYAAALDRLHALGAELAPTPDGSRRKFDLAHMRTLTAALGDPQAQYPSVLIAGTNGKGSTAATLAGILAAAGLRTALYTSPHLERVNERIQISSSEGAFAHIPDEDFARLYFHVDDTAQRLVAEGRLPHPPSYFETLTAIALLYFAEQKVDIAVLEVGLGGRLDATNIVEPIISIITDIALDHMDYLGPTLAHIAREKAGILRTNGTLITLPQHPEANSVIGEVATELGVNAINAAQFVPHTPVPHTPIEHEPHAQQTSATPLPRNQYVVTLDNQPLIVDSALTGEHQRRNLALAIAAAAALRTQLNIPHVNISHAAIEQGIRDTQWPGRLEFFPPNLLLDVAHNPAGAWTLRAALSHLDQTHPRTLIFSCLRDKDLREMAQILFPLFDKHSSDPDRAHDHIVLAPIANPRAASVDDLLAIAHTLEVPAHAAPHVEAAVAQARAVTPAGGLIVVTGSVYLIGEVRSLLNNEHTHGH